MKYKTLINFIRDIYGTNEPIPLHAPLFIGNESTYVKETIDSNFVSSVGKFVSDFEADLAKFTGSPRAVAVCSGTAALHTSLVLCEIKKDDYVITQSITFVATCNSISYCGAKPIFIDIDKNTLGLSPSKTEEWLSENAYIDNDGNCRNRLDDKKIKACIPMHTFGHPIDLDNMKNVCKKWNLFLIEDAAESLGSYYKGKHTGTFGDYGTLSFNGNKVITTGGGGAILSNEQNGNRAKHITTTGKVDHEYEYFHDMVAFNYRMPNINAALGVAQIEKLNEFLKNKRKLAKTYKEFFQDSEFIFFDEPKDSKSNFWLNAIICHDKNQRDELLKFTNKNNIMTRPIWIMMTKLPMWENSIKGNLENSFWAEERIVNIPSSVTIRN